MGSVRRMCGVAHKKGGQACILSQQFTKAGAYAGSHSATSRRSQSLDGLQLKAVPISPWKKGRKTKDGKAIHNSSGDCGDAGRIAHEELQHHPGAKRGAAEQGFYHSKRKDKVV